MAATPNTLDYFISGEPNPVLQGKSSTTTFDYFIVGEPLNGLNTVVVITHLLSLLGVGS